MTKQTKIGRGQLNRRGNFGCLRFLQIALWSAIAVQFGLSVRAQTYEYQFVTPISGSFQQGAADPGGGANGLMPWGGVGHLFDFGTLSETVYYNPVANTLQQVGSFTLDTTGFSSSFEDDKEVNGSLVSGELSVAYTLNNGNNTVSFNSGVQQVGANPTLDWSIPFSETITLTTGGQSYVDTMSGIIPEANDITSISQFTPNSIVISQGYQNINMNIGDQHYGNFNASDGWCGSIYDDIGDGYLGYSYYVAPITAFAVPEPGSLMIFGLGALSLKYLLSRRERRS